MFLSKTENGPSYHNLLMNIIEAVYILKNSTVTIQLSKNREHLTHYFFVVVGNGVFTKHMIPKNKFVIEYAGELLDGAEAEFREKEYKEKSEGCFLYFFRHNNKTLW